MQVVLKKALSPCPLPPCGGGAREGGLTLNWVCGSEEPAAHHTHAAHAAESAHAAHHGAIHHHAAVHIEAAAAVHVHAAHESGRSGLPALVALSELVRGGGHAGGARVEAAGGSELRLVLAIAAPIAGR